MSWENVSKIESLFRLWKCETFHRRKIIILPNQIRTLHIQAVCKFKLTEWGTLLFEMISQTYIISKFLGKKWNVRNSIKSDFLLAILST